MRRGRWIPRWLVRPLSQPLQRIGSWVSARYPFVWFARLPLWGGGGLLATLVAGLWARALSVGPEDLPGLESMVVMLSSWTFVVYALLLVLAVDIVRRGPMLLPGAQSLRLAGCVFVSTVCLLLPQYAFLRIALPRIAGVETHQQVEATLARHEIYGSWQCGTRVERARLLETYGDEIVRDLRRWGFPTNVAVAPGCVGLGRFFFPPGTLGYSLQMPANGVRGLSRSSSLKSLLDLNTSIGLGTFRGRLLTVDAAQHYVRGEASSFETTRTPKMAHDLLGKYAVGPPITSRLFQVPLVGLLMAVAIGFTAGTRFYRMRAIKASRLWLSAIRLQPVVMSAVEEWLASRLPTVWASRMHASILSLILLVLLGTLLANGLVNGALLWVAAPGVVVVGFVVLRAQENARHLTSGPWQPLGMFVLHWSSIGLCAAVIGRLLGITTGASLASVNAAMWLIAFVSAMLQIARFSSALLSYLAAIIAIAVLYAVNIGKQPTSLGNDVEVLLRIASTAGLFGLGLYLTARFEIRPAVGRLVVGVFVLVAGFAGITLSDDWQGPNSSDVTVPKMAASAILVTVVVAVALRLTVDYRRVLADSGR
jgi:hypothetical protein